MRTDVGRLAATDLTVRFGQVEALREVSCEFQGGGVHGLIGANGAGKTTLIHALMGLVGATSGSVTSEEPTAAIGYCPDTPSFEPWLTATEVIEQSASLGRAGSRPSEKAAHRSLERVGLARVADRRVGGFSRGQRQRLGVAAALIREPSVLILDEPTSALDPVGRAEMIELIGLLGAEALVLFSSHILDDVERVAQDVLILHEGHRIYAGPTSRFIEQRSDGDELTLTVRGDVEGLRVGLEQTGVRWHADALHGSRLRVPADDARQLFSVLADVDVVVLRLERSQASLQNAFLGEISAGSREAT